MSQLDGLRIKTILVDNLPSISEISWKTWGGIFDPPPWGSEGGLSGDYIVSIVQWFWLIVVGCIQHILVVILRSDGRTTPACAAYRSQRKSRPAFLFIVHQTAESCRKMSARLQPGCGVLTTGHIIGFRFRLHCSLYDRRSLPRWFPVESVSPLTVSDDQPDTMLGWTGLGWTGRGWLLFALIDHVEDGSLTVVQYTAR
jgi:hypothetical protein